MAPGGWTSTEQKDFLELWLPEYLIKKGRHELDQFWQRMKSAWYNEFPEESVLGFPVQQFDPDPNADPAPKLTDEQEDVLGAALKKRDSVSRASKKRDKRASDWHAIATPQLVQQPVREDPRAARGPQSLLVLTGGNPLQKSAEAPAPRPGIGGVPEGAQAGHHVCVAEHRV